MPNDDLTPRTLALLRAAFEEHLAFPPDFLQKCVETGRRTMQEQRETTLAQLRQARDQVPVRWILSGWIAEIAHAAGVGDAACWLALKLPMREGWEALNRAAASTFRAARDLGIRDEYTKLALLAPCLSADCELPSGDYSSVMDVEQAQRELQKRIDGVLEQGGESADAIRQRQAEIHQLLQSEALQ